MFSTKKENDKTPLFSFIYYYLPIKKELSSLNDVYLQDCKNAVFGNTSTFKISSELNEIKLNDCYSMFASNTGIGLFQTGVDYIKEDLCSILFKEYLKALKEMIHFEIKSKEFNRELDFGEYKNLDLLNKTVRKEMRNAVHLKYDIKNSVLTNSIKRIFFGKCLSEIGFNETLSEFIEICHSIENELHAKIDEREEEHDKHFDKILSVVAVFAIVSVFKDGSDLILSFIDAFQNCNFHQLKITEIISLGAPALCFIVLLILIKIFKKKT